MFEYIRQETLKYIHWEMFEYICYTMLNSYIFLSNKSVVLPNAIRVLDLLKKYIFRTRYSNSTYFRLNQSENSTLSFTIKRWAQNKENGTQFMSTIGIWIIFSNIHKDLDATNSMSRIALSHASWFFRCLKLNLILWGAK